MTEAEARKITAYLAALYDVPAWTPERLRAFRDAIGDLEYGAAQAAAQRYMRTAPRRPQPSDLRALVTQARLQLPGPEEAWGELHAAMQQCREQPGFSHAAIGQALRLTGRTWEQLRFLQFDQYPWLRRDFLAAYGEVRERVSIETAAQRAALPDPAQARALLHAVAAAHEGR
jgi:hypothetical protein